MEAGSGHPPSMAGPGRTSPGFDGLNRKHMARGDSITMTFPPFSGMVRTLVFANAAVYLGHLLLAWLFPVVATYVDNHFLLVPTVAVLQGEIWQFVTYSFFDFGLLSFVFNMLMIWFCGSILEGSYGARWFRDLYFCSVIGGALVASAISFTGILHLRPDSLAVGAGAGIFGILIAIAVRFGDLEFMLIPFPVRIRAKYMVAIYIFIDVALLLHNNNAFYALLALSGGLSGYLYVRLASRRGLGFHLSEQLFGMRNAYYRAKRRRAARKFEVYMGKQGRKVKFDDEGRYIDPDEERKNPNDKRWMN
jgi:membrane associated rhomboid family serine protease